MCIPSTLKIYTSWQHWDTRVCSLQHVFSLQSFDWSSLWHHRAWLRLDMLNPEWFYSLYDVTVAIDLKKRDKILLEDVVLAKSNFKQTHSRTIHKALATLFCVATHGLRNAALRGLEISHGQQQFQIVLLAPQQEGNKQDRRCSHSTWS